MSRKGEYGDTTQRCAYCGKPEVSWSSSISSPFINRHYCSLECSARDNQSLNLGCSLCILPVSVILSVGLVFDLLSQNRVDGAYLTLYSLVLLLQIIMVYHVYVGRTTPQSEPWAIVFEPKRRDRTRMLGDFIFRFSNAEITMPSAESLLSSFRSTALA